MVAQFKSPKSKDNHGFPSHAISPAEKGKDWCLRYCKAFHNEFSVGGGQVLRYAFKDYEKYRQYAAGKQPIDQYKEMLGVKKNKGKNDASWRNLDWNILPIVPTLVSVVKNKVLGQQKDIVIRGIDSISQNEERTRRNQILTHLSLSPLHQQAQQQFGLETPSPIDEGAPVPSTIQEVELHMQMYPKDRYVMELYDHIERVMEINKWKELWDEVVGDLGEVGVGVTKAWIDINGVVRVRRGIPERIITNHFIKPDGSDITRIGEYIEMSISELRASVPRGTFTEEDYAIMASKASGTAYDIHGVDAYFRSNFRYPYDHEKIMVLDAEWFSSDDYAYVKEISNRGNLNLTKQKNPYWLDKVEWTDETGKKRIGVSDKEYVEFHKKKGSDRSVIRDSVNNLYGGKWIVGTNYVFDFGLKTNMQRSLSSLGDCRSNYNIYTFFDSFMRKAEPIADDIQVNWLHYQNFKAQSRPAGLAINKRALTLLSVAGKGGMELNELDILRMYTETGNLVYKGEDAAGRPYQFDPIKELKGGLNPGAIECLDLIFKDIELLRIQFGLNEATDSSTPNPKLGKAIAEMLQQNTNTALGTVYHGYSRLFEETVKSIALLIPDAEMIKTAAKDEGLGESSGQFFRANNDVTYREMGIVIEDGPSNEARQALQKYIELDLQNGVITSADAFLIEKEGKNNLMRAYHLLALKARQKAESDQQRQLQLYEAEQQKNIQSATAAEQAKAQTAQMVAEIEMNGKMTEHQMEMERLAMEIGGKIALQKLINGQELTIQEMEMVKGMQEIIAKGRMQIAVEKSKPKPKAPARKSA
jgi:hypothetical protein